MDDNLQGLILLICVFSCLCCIIESTRDCEKCLMPDSIDPEKQNLYENKKKYGYDYLKIKKKKININNDYVELNDIKVLN